MILAFYILYLCPLTFWFLIPFPSKYPFLPILCPQDLVDSIGEMCSFGLHLLFLLGRLVGSRAF